MKLIAPITLILVFLLIGCSENKNVTTNYDSKLIGSWYEFRESDSSYMELYFDKEYVLYNLDYGLGPLLKYEVVNDSIMIFPEGTKGKSQFLFKIKALEEGYIELMNTEERTVRFQLLDTDFNIWEGVIVNSETREKAQKLWYKRYNERMYGSSSKDSNEELLEVDTSSVE